LGRFGQCPDCGDYDPEKIPEDASEREMLARAATSDEIFEAAIKNSGANAIGWELP
jgi:hypothetical protein